ncbi:hypothetical protein V6Z12_D06G099000, partial [Gossypium hirsutum]
FAYSNVHVVHRKQNKSSSPTSKPKPTNKKNYSHRSKCWCTKIARRGHILSVVASAIELIKILEENKGKQSQE